MRKSRVRRTRPLWVETLEGRALLSRTSAVVMAEAAASGGTIQSTASSSHGNQSVFVMKESEGGYEFTDTYAISIARGPQDGLVGGFNGADAFNVLIDRFSSLDSNVAGTPSTPVSADVSGDYIVTSEHIRTSGTNTVYQLGLSSGGEEFLESVTVKAKPTGTGLSALSVTGPKTFGNFISAFSAAATARTGNTAFGAGYTSANSGTTGTGTTVGSSTTTSSSASTSGTGNNSTAAGATSTGGTQGTGTGGTTNSNGSTTSSGNNGNTVNGGSTSTNSGTGTGTNGTGTGSGTGIDLGSAGTSSSGTVGTGGTSGTGTTAGTGAGAGSTATGTGALGTSSGTGSAAAGTGNSVDSGGGTGGTNGAGDGGSTGTGAGVTTGTTGSSTVDNNQNGNTGSPGQGLSTGQ